MRQESSPSPIEQLLILARQARCAASSAELAFLAVNDSHALAPYRQAALWFDDSGVRALSGVVQIEANAPYAQWLERACRVFARSAAKARTVTAVDLAETDVVDWATWLPAFGLWLPLAAGTGAGAPKAGGLLFARDVPWLPHEIALFSEWADIWRHAWQTHFRPNPWSIRHWRDRLARGLRIGEGGPWWRRKSIRLAAIVLAIILLPVRLSVLAPGELVPANPGVVRAPLDGIVAQFHVRPNQFVKAGEPLLGLDEAVIGSKLDVAMQSLATADAEYRQTTHLAVSDARAKGQLAMLMGKIEERRAEVEYLRGMIERARVVAPQDGIVMFDDPSEWIGKPISAGERIMRIAAPGDMEVEAWVPVGDAIPLEQGAPVSLYLSASPLFSVSARVRYAAHDAVQRPDGSFAYRVRAELEGSTDHRVGLKGTARLSGKWVPLGYWVLRRPLALVRQTLGW